MKLDILAIGAHPDDVELGCAGTLAKMIAMGKTVGILDLTQGELGTRGSAQTRTEETANASKILQIKIRENLKFRDGFFVNDEKHQLEVIKVIRKFKPEIILANTFHDRHPDHGKAAKLVDDANFLSGLQKVHTEINGISQEKWRANYIFNYIQWEETPPDFIIDISEYMKSKLDVCMTYKTQFYNPKSNEPNTPITSENFKKASLTEQKI